MCKQYLFTKVDRIEVTYGPMTYAYTSDEYNTAMNLATMLGDKGRLSNEYTCAVNVLVRQIPDSAAVLLLDAVRHVLANIANGKEEADYPF